MQNYTTNNNDALSQTWTEYVASFAHWTTFLTLTFEQADRTHNVTQTEAQFKFRRLVQVLNNDLYGHHYTRCVGHSYFAYALAFENHKSGLLHMHALLDNRTNWQLIKRYWQGEKRPYHMGIADIKRVSDIGKTAKYLCKYVTKGGDVVLYKPEKLKEPKFKPDWYMGIQGSFAGVPATPSAGVPANEKVTQTVELPITSPLKKRIESNGSFRQMQLDL